MYLGRDLACEQALRGALAGGREKEKELATTSLDLTAISNSSLVPRRLSCQIFTDQRAAGASANVNMCQG